MSNRALNELWEIYGEAFCLHAHQLLAWAYTDVRARLNAEMDEPSITGLLAEAMKARLNHPDTPNEYDHYWPGDQEPHSPNGELGNDRLRFDITIIRNGIKPRITFIFEAKRLLPAWNDTPLLAIARITFIFEAKRLRTGGFPIGKYIGNGGMGDFIECRYGADHPEAAMVALFQNKDVEYWHGELKRVFNEDQASEIPRLGIHKTLSSLSILVDLPGELQSIHSRSNGEIIRICHVFLNCC